MNAPRETIYNPVTREEVTFIQTSGESGSHITIVEILLGPRGKGPRGTYTVADNRLTRRNVTHGDPAQEGIEQTQLFRAEGDMLILSSADPKVKNEARFRRVK